MLPLNAQKWGTFNDFSGISPPALGAGGLYKLALNSTGGAIADCLADCLKDLKYPEQNLSISKSIATLKILTPNKTFKTLEAFIP